MLAKELPLEIARENLKLREGRQGIDLVSDPVESELNKVCKAEARRSVDLRII